MADSETRVFWLRGVELAVRETPAGWHVRWGEREADGAYLDHVVAEVLGWHRSGVLRLVGQILACDPGSELTM